MAFPTGWSSKKLYIPQAKVSGSANHSNFPVLLKDGAIPAAVYSAMQTGEINSSWIKTLSNLKLYCRFESGALTTDSSGNSHTLTAISDPAETTGVYGGGVDLDGNDAFSIVDHADLKPTGSFTIGGRIKTTSTDFSCMFASASENTAAAGIVIFYSASSGKLNFQIGKNTGTTANVDRKNLESTTLLNDGAYHYWCCTWDGTNMKMHIDFKLEGTLAAFAPVYAATNYVRVGCFSASGTNTLFFTGSADEMFLINGTALTLGQIMSLQIGGGADLRFSTDSAGTTEIPFEIVKITPASSTGEVWLKIPTLYYNQNTDFYIWYGKNDATPYEATDTYGSQAVWSDYAGVWHLEGNSRDATANGNHGADTDMVYSTSNGQFGQGVAFNGSSSRIVIPASTAHNFTSDCTLSTWFYPTTVTGVHVLFHRQSHPSSGWNFYQEDDVLKFSTANGTNSTSVSNSLLTNNTGQYIAVVKSGTSATFFKNGSVVTKSTSATHNTASLSQTMQIGRDPSGVQYLQGRTDESRMRASALSNDWQSTEYTMFSDPVTFVSAVSTFSVTKSLGYSILNIHSVTKSQQYAVKRPISLTKSAQYAIYRTIAAITKGLEYVVAPQNVVLKSLQYAILTMTGIQKDMAYKIIADNAITKQFAYAILTDTQLQKAMIYSIMSIHSLTKAMQYVIYSSGRITKGMTYEIGRNGYIYQYSPRGTVYERYEYDK